MTFTRRSALAASLALLSSNALAQSRSHNARTALAPGGPIEHALDQLAREGRFSGAVLGAIDGEPLLTSAWGMADRERGIANTVDTRFNIASAGKMFTTVAIGQLLERGAVRLNDRVAQHLPGFPAELGERISIAQLLTHTSGLGSYFGSPNWAERAAHIRTLEDYLSFVREERVAADYDGSYRYSNSGFVVLGAIVAQLTQLDFYDAMQANVFAPAGMTRSGYPLLAERAVDIAIGYTNGCFGRPPTQCTPQALTPAQGWPGRGGPAGGGVSTVRDLHAFVEALKSGALISHETLDMMKAERGRMPRPGGPIDAYGLGFGRLTIHGRPSWGHNGGTPGAQAQVDIFEDEALTLIVLSNQDGGQRAASAAMREAAA